MLLSPKRFVVLKVLSENKVFYLLKRRLHAATNRWIK